MARYLPGTNEKEEGADGFKVAERKRRAGELERVEETKNGVGGSGRRAAIILFHFRTPFSCR